MKPSIPSSRFEEQEVDHLIGAFGIKPSDDNRRDILTFLRGQKEQFKEQERQRGDKTKLGPERRL